jgi:hypothetical protein
MQPEENDQSKLVDYLLESLHYQTPKEDTAITENLRTKFGIPPGNDLRGELIRVDFSDLFAELLIIVEPFAQMMNEVYCFLAKRKTTARSPQRLIVGESVSRKLSFDLNAFPKIYQPVIQKIEGYLQVYDLPKVLNCNISPLLLTEGLLGSGHCNDPDFQRTGECQLFGEETVRRFKAVFQRLKEIIVLIPDETKKQPPYEYQCRYAEESERSFREGKHWNDRCYGCQHWQEYLTEIERRFELVSKKRLEKYDIEVFHRFFNLPFWKERNRLYEIWTLTHFLHLLRGVTIDLNLKNDEWHLIYSDAREPVCWIRGHNFEIEIWYQHKLKAGLGAFESAPVEPEMLLNYRGIDGNREPFILIECKERMNYDVREIYKLSTFYRSQVGASLSFFCNYYEYSPAVGMKLSKDDPPIILCDHFQPGSSILAQVDQKFIELVNSKLGVFLQTLLVDVSGSMQGKDIAGVFKELVGKLSSLPGSKTLSGIFADTVRFFELDEFERTVKQSLVIGGGTKFETALRQLEGQLRKDHPENAIINFFVITDVDFGNEDWKWLHEVEISGNLNITFVSRQSWLSEDSIERLKEKKRIKLMIV